MEAIERSRRKKSRAHDLEGDLAARFVLLGEVDHAHAPLAEKSDKPVAPDTPPSEWVGRTIDLQVRRPYTVLILIAGGIMLIATHPKIMLVVMAYAYLASGFIEMAITRFRRRGAHTDTDRTTDQSPSMRLPIIAIAL